MHIILSGKGMALTDALENYVTKKVNALDKFFPGIIRADVTIGMENKKHVKGNIFFAEGTLAVPGKDVFVKCEGKDEYATIDALKDGMERELSKRKTKMRPDAKKKKVIGRAKKEYVSTEEDY